MTKMHESTSISSEILNILVSSTYQQIAQNKLVQQVSAQFINRTQSTLTDQLLNQAEKRCIVYNKNQSLKMQAKPKRIVCDNRVCRSLSTKNNNKSKNSNNQSLPSNSYLSNNKTNKQLFTAPIYSKPHTQQIDNDNKNLRVKINQIIRIPDQLNQNYCYSDVKSRQQVKKQQNDQLQVQLRKTKIQQAKQSAIKQKISPQKIFVKPEPCKNNIQKRKVIPNGLFTYDISGQILPFRQSRRIDSLSKPYPTAVNFSFLKQQKKEKYVPTNCRIIQKLTQPSKIPTINQSNHKNTINTQQSATIDSQIFSNHQNRQTTNIPFLKPQNGISYTEVRSVSAFQQQIQGQKQISVRHHKQGQQQNHRYSRKVSSSFKMFSHSYFNTSLGNRRHELCKAKTMDHTSYFSSRKLNRPKLMPQSANKQQQKHKKRTQSAYLSAGKKRSSPTKNKGVMTEINESLLTQLIL